MIISRLCVFFFFFNQKSAYEMRISDWSSDVCSSDLRMLVAHVALGRNAEVARQGEEAAVLARAVVVSGGRHAAAGQQREQRRLVARELRAAFQIGDREPDAGEPGGHGVDVTRLAAVAGAGQRQTRLAPLESVGAAALDAGDGLQRPDGGE